MKESWIDPVRYEHVEKIILKKCKHADDFCVLFSAEKGKERYYKVQYKDKGVSRCFYLHEFGETADSSNPFDNIEYFKIAKKLNEGRIINGKTFEQAFIEHYYEQNALYRDYMLDDARDEKDPETYRKLVSEAEDEYRKNFDAIEKFAKKYKIEPADEEDLVQE